MRRREKKKGCKDEREENGEAHPSVIHGYSLASGMEK
jgi:hypothetical protein